ncbi:hypothetical protein MACJ_002459 [Theileria orientalis]|uniref:Immune mapped protein 2 N-terminal domain-containing protein n=1 Tax=Theileria orientalis TaxID=68886 RepID=A0A976M638_THEOR|nr:hypothetical protein MACJ_002459 [Theileria orientalis]
MELFNKIFCSCCGKPDKEEGEADLMIENFLKNAWLIPSATHQKESKISPRVEIPVVEEDKKGLSVRKHVKLKKKPIQKIDIGGAVAALPPPPVEEIVGSIPKVSDSYDTLNLGAGVYLIYSLENNGSLYLQYANRRPESMDGILGYIRPGKEILSYHYENKDGKYFLSTNVCEYMQSKFQHDRKKYYDVWHEFLQILNSYGGSLYLLKPFGLSPPPKIRLVLFSNSKRPETPDAGAGVGGVLSELGTCREVVLKENELVGVLPFSLDYTSKLINGVNRLDFSKLCEKYGSLFESTHPPT